MALSTQRAISDGTLVLLDISITYLDRSEISVFLDSIVMSEGTGPNEWQWVGDTERQVQFNTAVPDGVEVLLRRTTDISELRHQFSRGAVFGSVTLDEALEQTLHVAQEAREGGTLGDIFQDLNMHGFQMKNIGPPTEDSDAVSLGYYRADALGASAARAAAEAAAASAAGSLIATNTAKDRAVLAETNAQASANAAANSATSANNSRIAAAASESAAATSAASIANRDQWKDSTLTATREGPQKFSLVGDRTVEFHRGRRLQLNYSALPVQYADIVSSSHVGGVTTVNLQVDSGGIIPVTPGPISPWLSILRADNQAVPSYLNQSVTLGGVSLIEAMGISIASAAVTDIWQNTDGNTVTITGNGTISTLGTAPQAGATMRLLFTGTPTLVQSANLGLNGGGGNVTLGAGDMAYVVAVGVSQFEVFVLRKSGQPIVSLSVPTGTIIDFAGSTAPSGYIACPTASNSAGNRVTHADLFAVIGTTWGAGDGTTTFGLPWFATDNAAVHTGGTVGTQTAGAVITHTHTATQAAHSHTALLSYYTGIGGTYGNPPSIENVNAYSTTSTTGAAQPAITVTATGGASNLAAGSRVRKCVKL